MTRAHHKIRRVRHFSIVWRGILIKLKYQYKHVAADRWQEPKDRLSIVIVGPNADLCPPLTDYAPSTVYVQTAHLKTLGGPVAYVTRLLTLAASNPKWIKTERRRRQLDLFPDTSRTPHAFFTR
jgi:hypothetical protein